MILLTSTSDKMQVITTAAGTVDVHASFADASGSPVAVTLGRTNTHITTATTTDIVAAPAASTSRNVKQLKISNNHASVTNTVTLQHTDGSTVVPIEQCTLLPGERMGYEEGVGIRVFDALGREKIGFGTGFPGTGSTADVVCTSADTYLLGFPIGNRVTTGSSFHWTMRATKTGAGVAAATFNVRTGTAGTTADTSRCLHTFSAIQTAVTDTGWIEVNADFRAVGATAVLQSIIKMDHLSADAAGMGTCRYQQTLSSSFDVTPLGTIIGLTCNPGASGVWTFQYVTMEAHGLLN